MPTRKKDLKPDSAGNYRPYIGWRKDGKQQKFSLGKDKAIFESRREKIQKLYAESCQVCRHLGKPESWTEAALYAAKLIADGHDNILLPPADVLEGFVGEPTDRKGSLLWRLRTLENSYPSVKWIIPDDLLIGELFGDGALPD